MKKFISLLLCVACLFTLASCTVEYTKRYRSDMVISVDFKNIITFRVEDIEDKPRQARYEMIYYLEGEKFRTVVEDELGELDYEIYATTEDDSNEVKISFYSDDESTLQALATQLANLFFESFESFKYKTDVTVISMPSEPKSIN